MERRRVETSRLRVLVEERDVVTGRLTLTFILRCYRR